MLKPKETEKSKEMSTPCGPKRILQAVSILKQLNQKYYENTQKKSLLDDESENPVILQLTMKKIPPATMQKFIKVHLPKSMLTDKNEVCLITGDLDKRNTKAEVEPDVLHFKELLKKEKISQVNEVITLRQLRKEYKPYEARRQLCGAYDVFLCDRRIAGVLPSTLGKSFFRKRKCPIQINMQTSKLKEQVENALSSTVFHITCKGNSCASEVANLSMNDEDILSNVVSSIDTLKEQLPGQWDNVLGIYVKTPKSKAIPLYMSNDDPNDFNFAKKRTRPKAVTAELSTLPNTEVKVFRDGRVIVKSKKRTGSDTDTSDSEEEYSSNESMKQSVKLDEESFPLISGNEEVDNDKQKKQSKKRKSNLNSVVENSEEEAQEEEISNSKVENLRNKKRKSNVDSGIDSSELKVNKEVQNSEKKKKKHELSGNLTEESAPVELENQVEAEITEKKSKKRKSRLLQNEEITEVNMHEENVKTSGVEKQKRKSKIHNTNFDEIEETIEDPKLNLIESKGKGKKQDDDLQFIEKSIEIKHSEVEKLDKKSKKSKSTLGQDEEVVEIKANEKSIDISEKQNKKRKSKLIQEEITEIKANEESVDVSEIRKEKRKSKGRKSNFNEDNFEAKILEDVSKNPNEIKSDKKSKKSISNVASNAECIEIKEKTNEDSRKIENKNVSDQESAEGNVKSLSLKRKHKRTKTQD